MIVMVQCADCGSELDASTEEFHSETKLNVEVCACVHDEVANAKASQQEAESELSLLKQMVRQVLD